MAASIRTKARAGSTIATVLFFLIGSWLALIGDAASPVQQKSCPDYILSNERLTEILRNSLGGVSNLIQSSSATVNPSKPGCYVEMKLESILPDCILTACSSAVFEQPRKIGIKQFRIQGCNSIFALLG